MYVVTIEYTESQFPEYSIMGPYATRDDAEKARVEFINKMEDTVGDWSAVYQLDVKMIRSMETSYDAHIAIYQLYTRTYDDVRTLEPSIEIDTPNLNRI